MIFDTASPGVWKVAWAVLYVHRWVSWWSTFFSEEYLIWRIQTLCVDQERAYTWRRAARSGRLCQQQVACPAPLCTGVSRCTQAYEFLKCVWLEERQILPTPPWKKNIQPKDASWYKECRGRQFFLFQKVGDVADFPHSLMLATRNNEAKIAICHDCIIISVFPA